MKKLGVINALKRIWTFYQSKDLIKVQMITKFLKSNIIKI